MGIDFNNKARVNAASDMILMLHLISLRIVKGFEEYQHKIRGSNSTVNLRRPANIPLLQSRNIKNASVYFLFSWVLLHCYFTPA